MQDKTYRLCFSSAGIKGLDKHRFDIMHKCLLEYNKKLQDNFSSDCCNFITTHVDAELSQLLLKDSSIKSRLDISWQVPYEQMFEQLSKSCCQLIAGDNLYDSHHLLSNKWVEGCLAGTVNLVVGTWDPMPIKLHKVFFDSDSVNGKLWYNTVNYFAYSEFAAKQIVELQWKQFKDWCTTYFVELQKCFS